MYTYQDLQAVGDEDSKKMDFMTAVINNHKNSDDYETAKIAQEYIKKCNVTQRNYQKLLYTVSGIAVPDNYSANYKLCSNFFDRFVTQEVQFLLGNGVSFADASQKEKLGKDFDTKLQLLGKYALVDGVSFGYFNLDKVETFRLTEFAPLYNEETGALMAGVRFWQIDSGHPLRATLYEPDGYTEYIWREGRGEVYKPKLQYKLKVRTSVIDGTEILGGENYPSFPIIPMWGNLTKQSELIGIREQIDAYDLIKSGFCNTVDEASYVYWTIQNAGGMDDIDLAKFVERMRTVKAAVIEDEGAKPESHTMEVPYASREALLDRIRNDLYDDFMALDTKQISSGAATATQIKAAYEPINNKADQFEYCVREFLDGLFFVAGIDTNVSFTRSLNVNTQELVSTLIQAATHLPDEYVTRKILELLGDGDKADEYIEDMIRDNLDRLGGIDIMGETGENDEVNGESGEVNGEG